MAEPVLSTTGEVPCTYHPQELTYLRCGRCFKPICPKCGVRTPVGLRCPECTGVRSKAAVRADPASNAIPIAIGMLVALAVGVGWAFFPEWRFYWTLILGFGVAESMARFAPIRHGIDLQVAGMVAVGMGLVVSRLILAQRLDVPLDLLFEGNEVVRNVLQLQLIPDGVYAALAVAIPWIRFR